MYVYKYIYIYVYAHIFISAEHPLAGGLSTDPMRTHIFHS